MDIAARTGTPIAASKAGTVTFAGSQSGYGNVVYISHGGGVETRYGHMSKITCRRGLQVSQGQKIGEVGSTGHATGPHVHFEIRINGSPVNPAKYI
jgi:murein DD-endopeptidase MepM/ murein hydrolase activator NlpD